MKIRIWGILSIIIITLAIYIKSVNNDFINWDDDKLVYQNDDIKQLDFGHVKTMFSTFYVQMYQPLSSLTYAVEYKFFGANPKVYHLDNILLHILNSILLLLFVLQLSRNNIVSWLTAILFAIHPMHVESVAWIAERKDLLYTFFYLISLIFYLSYLEKGYRIKHLLFALLFFVFSLLSKSAAVTLPLVLILLDFYKGRKLNFRNSFDKIPFFLLSLIFGIVGLYSQLGLALPKGLYEHQTIIDRFFIASYSLVFYFFKFFVPVKLATIHPFPVKSSQFLPFIYYLSFGIVIFTSVLVYSLRNNVLVLRIKKEAAFGLAFFICTISIVLSLPVGAAVVAERYSYISYIGLMFAFSTICNQVYRQLKPNSQKVLIIAITGIVLLFSFISYNRLSVWKERIGFWTDIIQKYPMKVPLAYHNRGLTYYRQKDYVAAINDFNVVISQKPFFSNTYSFRGMSKSALNNPMGAIADFSSALMLKSDLFEIYNSRGLEYKKMNDLNAAFNDFNSSIRINPSFADAYTNLGLLFLESGRPKEAIQYFSKSIEISPKTHENYYNRGLAYNALQDFLPAINDFNKVIAIDDKIAVAYCDRGISKAQLGNAIQAIEDFSYAIKLDPSFSRAYLDRGIARLTLNDADNACIDFVKANSPVNEKATYYLNKFCKQKK